MMHVTSVVIYGPLFGRWYVTPFFDRGERGGSTGFDSMNDAEGFATKKFAGAEVLRAGNHANPMELPRLRKVLGK